MNKVLLIGENPSGPTGNGLMMQGILGQIDPATTEVFLFCPCSDFAPNLSIQNSIRIIPSDDLKRQDIWGSQKLLTILSTNNLDFIAFIGVDIWRYASIIQNIKQIQQRNKFKIIHLFPYDLQYLDREFIQYANMIDIPCVYSQYGFDMLKDHVSNLQYFRPYMPHKELFFPYSDEKRQEARSILFPTVSPDTFIFGFIGPNQIRKDPQKVIKAFSMLKNMNLKQKSILYMHTDFRNGVFNLPKYAASCGLVNGDLLTKPEDSYSPFEKMPDIYNALDCFVNCSMQEGLSWTTIQAMLCGVPIIASDSTAHIELVKGFGQLCPCSNESYIPIKTVNGSAWIDAKSCTYEDIFTGMKYMLKYNVNAKALAVKGIEKMKNWFDGCSNFNDLTKIMPVEAAKPLIPAILFMQHSAAGDVLMTTRCLKRIREKHNNLPLVYMTQEKFQGIVKGNPDVTLIADWNPELRTQYQVVYNPHGEHILKGGFNNLDVKLADMYPYFCKVKPDDFFIDCEQPDVFFVHDERLIDKSLSPNQYQCPAPYVVVHTTGGDPQYRTYSHMGMVVKGLTLPVVQIGSVTDIYCPGAIDLRGILSFNETAWVMKNASAAIVIDSFPAHLAGALDTPCIVLYGPAPARVVGPIHKGVPENLWFDMEPNKLDVCPNMTNCHGQIRSCQSPCINSINPMEIKKNLVKILEQVIPYE
jgi:glycosyltransferase involved in cell wall biosynthesis